MNDVITRAKAAVLGLRVPSPKVPDQSPVHQEPIQNWQATTSPAQPQYASPPAPEHPIKPSSFAPDPAEFNKPLYMRGPPQQQHIQQQQQYQQSEPQQPLQQQQPPLHHPEQHQRYPPSTHSAPENPHNGDYRGNGRGYPTGPMDNGYPPAQQAQQNNRATMLPREEMYDRKYPPAEPKRYPPDVPHRPPYHSNQPEQRLPDTAPRFFSAPPRNPNVNRPVPPGMTMPPRGIPNQSPREDQKPIGNDGGYGPPRSSYGGPPGHPRGPTGPVQSNRSMEESGDTAVYQQERYNGPVALQQDDRRPSGGPRALFPAINRQDGPPVNSGGSSGPPSHHNKRSDWRDDNGQSYGGNAPPWQSNHMQKPGPNSGPPMRKPLISKTPAPYNSEKPGIPPLVPSGGRPPIPPSQSMRQPQPPMTRTPLLGPNFGNGPNAARAPPTVPKYVELSRLPTEMLRPAVLEQFLRPSVPLQVSSVKVVYSSQGIHMNTLVRFDNPADADAVLARDGELGIRVRPTTKTTFEDAVDGLPPAILSASSMATEALAENADHKRDSEHSRRRSRSRSRDRRRARRDSSPRKRQRSRTRSRDRRSARRSRSRSAPKRSRQAASSTRWCLQLTNVPFRCTEQELIEWMSERVRPSKVTRTFYADGNASDRWIAEFESESLMERAMGIKRLLIGRTVKMCHIENEQADELLKIEDVYGERRKESSEKAANADHRDIKPLMRDVPGFGHGPDRAAPVSFFPAPARGVSAFGPGGYPGAGGAGPAGRGRGMGRGFPPSPFPRDGPRGRGRGSFGGRGGMRGGHSDKPNMNSSHDSAEGHDENQRFEPPKSPEPEPAAATDDLVASLGPKGTVVSCCGFPSDVTMEDVLGFFKGYPVDHNSVRIRMGDDGIPTGECMLAMSSPESSKKAVSVLAGRKLRGQVVSLQLANP